MNIHLFKSTMKHINTICPITALARQAVKPVTAVILARIATFPTGTAMMARHEKNTATRHAPKATPPNTAAGAAGAAGERPTTAKRPHAMWKTAPYTLTVKSCRYTIKHAPFRRYRAAVTAALFFLCHGTGFFAFGKTAIVTRMQMCYNDLGFLHTF